MSNKILNYGLIFSALTTNMYATEYGIYIVKSGDTLGGIAQHYGVSSREIKKLNEDKISDRDSIYPGMTLKVPYLDKNSSSNENKQFNGIFEQENENVDQEDKNETKTSIYVVKPGDTLGGIAQRYGLSSREIKKLNEDKISDRNTIYPGMSLNVPYLDESSTEEDNKQPFAEVVEQENLDNIKTDVYVVKSGDTLGGIAQRYGLSSREIKKLNEDKISDRNVIYPGMTLKVPYLNETSSFKESSQINKVVEQENIDNTKANTYVVKNGDTLGGIAQRYGVSSREIKKLNEDKISDRNIIYPGMVLNVPQDKTHSSQQTEETSEYIVDDVRTGIYTVKVGDTLGGIAQRYGVSSREIKKLNEDKISDRNVIYPGMKLVVPGTNNEKIENENKITLETEENKQKVLKLEVGSDSYVELYYEGKIIGYKTAKDQSIINIQGDILKLGDKIQIKSYSQDGKIEEKEVEIDSKKITFITFIDNNDNNELDISDTLVTSGKIETEIEKHDIDFLGTAEFRKLEIGKTYDFIINSEDKNIINKKIQIKIDNDKIYIPIKNKIYSIEGKLNITSSKGLFAKKNKYRNEDILIRMKNEMGYDVALLPVSEDGKFFIEEISKGNYYCDIEHISMKGIEIISKDQKISINDAKNIELNVEKKGGIFFNK